VKTLILTIFIFILLACSNSTHDKVTFDCNNRINISELGIEFCLPDSNWSMKKSQGIRIFINSDTVYKSVIQLAIKVDLFLEDWSSEHYRDEQLNEYLTDPRLTTKFISKGSEIIDEKTFYYSEIKMKMNSNKEEFEMYSYTMFFMDNRIGYLLDAVVLDKDYKIFNKNKILSIWKSLKIIGKPDMKEITKQ